MSNEKALDHLSQAIHHIKQSRSQAENPVAEKELENLEATAEDCRSGLISDYKNKDSEENG